MALSVLRISPYGDNCVVYCSVQKKAILLGTQAECEEWRDVMHDNEQKQANREYFDNLREERLALLVSAGHSQQSATEFLTKQMPYLYEVHSNS